MLHLHAQPLHQSYPGFSSSGEELQVEIEIPHESRLSGNAQKSEQEVKGAEDGTHKTSTLSSSHPKTQQEFDFSKITVSDIGDLTKDERERLYNQTKNENDLPFEEMWESASFDIFVPDEQI